MDPNTQNNNDWQTVLSDLRRSVSNLVLYVLECVPLAVFPSGPAPPNAAAASNAHVSSSAAAPAHPVVANTLDEAIAQLVTQEPWMAPWMTSQQQPQQQQQQQQQSMQQESVSPPKKPTRTKKKVQSPLPATPSTASLPFSMPSPVLL